jgi:predicted GNAT family N-acyltransferase
MDIRIHKITDDAQLRQAFEIRHTVFVVEQHVDPELEYDEFEEIAVHFLVSVDGKAIGTARWRKTDHGIKLERFAVLSAFRNRGIGSGLVEAVLKSLPKGPYIYLHAQLSAISLYQKFGFQKVGHPFEEAGIQHYKMELKG